MGQRSYPHDQPWLTGSIARQQRKSRWEYGHSFRAGHCRWTKAASFRLGRQLAGSGRQQAREAQVRHDYEPTAGLLGNVDGRELGQGGEEEVEREDSLETARRTSQAAAADNPAEGETANTGGALGSRDGPGQGDPPEPEVR